MEKINTLQTATSNAIATFNFKSAALNAYSKQIASIGNDMAVKSIEIAKILGKVKSEKCYELDGFKSVADYAEKTFGMAKSQAYQRANIGERFLNGESDVAKKVAATFSPANMAELLRMEDKDIEAALDAGAISAKSTQKELREIANNCKPASKPTVEKLHDIFACIISGENIRVEKVQRMTIPAFETMYLESKYGFTDIVSKRFNGDSKEGVMLYLSSNGDFAKISYDAASPAPTTSKGKQKFTIAELKAMLAAAMNEDEDEDKDEDGE